MSGATAETAATERYNPWVNPPVTLPVRSTSRLPADSAPLPRHRRCASVLPLALALVLATAAAPVRAQSTSPAVPPRLEVAAGTWVPSPGIRLSADGDGVPGSEVDLQRDLALSRSVQWDLRVTFTPGHRGTSGTAGRHQFTAEYLPLVTAATSTLPRSLAFVGGSYAAGQPASSGLTWRTWRGGYRYALRQDERLSWGLNVDLWYSDLRLRVTQQATDREGRSRLPIPGIGTSVRIATSRRTWLTGAGSMFVIPDKPDHHFGGRYVNLSASAAVRIAGPLAAEAGVRWLDLRHLGKANTGFGRVSGVYIGGLVAR